MTQFDCFDIAIIGGGMVGASLALLLAQQNPRWQVGLLEAQTLESTSNVPYVHSFDARSTAVAQGSQEIFQTLGIWEKLSQHATSISQVHVSDAGHFMGGLIDAQTYGLKAVGYVIPNQWLGEVLLASIQKQPNIDLRSPVCVEKITPLQKGVRIETRSDGTQKSIKAKLAVIADGGDSPLRKALGIDSVIKDYGQTALIANVSYTEPHAGIAYERFTPQGPLALLPLGERPSASESALILTLPQVEADELFHANDEVFLQHLQQRFGHRLGRFNAVSQRHRYPLKLISASEQIRSNIVLVGNAAHFLHPVAGQGFNLSLRDCACMANALARGDDIGKGLGELSVLQNYLDHQKRDQEFTIQFSDKLVRLFSSASIPLIALRHLGFLGLDLVPMIKSQFAAQTMGTASRKF